MLKSRVGYVLARKYYELSPEATRLLITHPNKAGDFIDAARFVMDTTGKMIDGTFLANQTAPIIPRDRGQRIKAFLSWVDTVQDLTPELKGHLTALHTLLVLASTLNPAGSDNLTFGDLIRMNSGQLAQLSANVHSSFEHYAAHENRKLNPHFVAIMDTLVGAFLPHAEEVAVVSIQNPALVNRMFDIAVPANPNRAATTAEIKQWVVDIASASENADFAADLNALAAKL